MHLNKSDLEKLSINDYEIDHKVEIKRNIEYHKLFFKDKNNNLISYISFNIINLDVAYIINITNSNWYKYMPNYIKEIYTKNWYTKWTEIEWFWSTALTYTLEYIKNKYSNINIVVINSAKKSEKIVDNLINNIKNQTYWLIENITGWNEMNYCTIFLNKTNKNS